MKNIVFICFLWISFSVNSQGNLQFNQVLLVSTVQTVPVGKVWKIESVTYSGGLPFLGASSASATADQIKINSINQVVRSLSSQYNGGMTVWEQTFPIWLPSGTTLEVSTGVNNISVIEFNIVP